MKKEMKNATMMPRLTKFMFVVGFLLTTIMSYANNLAYAQNQTFTFHLKNVSIKTVLQTIEKQSEFIFMYRSDLLDTSKKVSVDADKKSVSQILDQILEGTAVTYEINDRQIVLKKTEIINNQSSGPQQSKRIYGVVKDEAGETVIGANVWVKGTTTGVVTDIDGRYQITLNDPKAILVFSYLGMKTQEVAVGNKLEINIVLVPDAERLDEVVVVGYGVQKKVNLTGSVSVLTDESINNRPFTNSTQALQGIQGLYVNQAGGQPGKDNATIRIRGVGTLNDNDPLVLVDGVPSSLSDVNPSNIANISVLKDAASAAIYGSRAANGVILVTTKTGEKGKFSVQYNNSFGIQKVTYLPDAVWDPILFMEGWNTAYENEGKALLYSKETIEEYKKGMATNPHVYSSTNWFDIAFNDAFTMEHNIRLSGGSDKLLMSMSVGYLDQDGVLIGTDNKKLSVNFNGTAILGNLKAGINVSGTFRNFNEPHMGASGFMNYTMRSLPVMPEYTEDGRYGRSWLTTPGQNTFFNLTAHVNEGMNNHKQTRLLGNIFAEYSLPFDIKYKLTMAVNKYDEINRVLTPIVVTYNPKTLEPQKSTNEQTVKNYSNNNIDPSLFQTLSWNKKIMNAHDIALLLGMSYEEFNEYDFSATAQGYLDNTLVDLDAGSKNYTASGQGNKVKLLSYFGRLNYSYKDKYLFEANFRYDGSSRFAKGHQWGLFPSFSAAWRIDQESFLSDVSWLSNMKLRASWGKLGNQQIGIYKYVSSITLGQNAVFGTTVKPGGAVTTAVDPNITWETTTMVNGALDFGFFNNKLSGSFEVFKKRTSDILRQVNLPSQVGNLNGPIKNIGVVDNVGFELGLSYGDKIQDFGYNFFGSLTKIKNKVVDISGQEIISGRNIIKEGYPIDSYYLYICDGIFQSEDEIKNHAVQSHNTSPGDLKFRDVDEDGMITEKDRVVTGKVIPDLTYSFGVNSEFKGISLNLLFQGVFGVDTYPTANLATPYNNGAGVTYEWLERAWTPNNTNGGFPRLMTANSGHDNFAKASTFWLKDASYLRLKNVQLCYEFPSSLISKLNIKGLKVFINGENLLTFSKFDIFDPEKSLKGTNLYEYPSVKTFTGGINLTF